MVAEAPFAILLLGGTTEARRAAERLAADPQNAVTLSLAGRTASPVLPAAPVVVRSGGFGGVDGLAAALTKGCFALLIDATHPFSATIGRNAAEAAAQAGVPLLRIERPAWRAEPGDRWTKVGTLEEAAMSLVPGATVFLTVGADSLAPFLTRTDVRFVVRSIEAPAVALPGAKHVRARGPFTVADETRFLTENAVTALVTKNAGGKATAAKLAAARRLGIPVIMVHRPDRPAADVADVDALLERVAAIRSAHHSAAP